MGDYVDVLGHPTWVEDPGGEGEPVLLLHGGMDNGDSLLDSIGPALLEDHHVLAFDRRGHGRTGDTPEPFHYEAMADETIAVLEQVVGGPAHLVGWSDGGIVSLLVARRRPDLVRTIVPIGTNFHFEGLLDADIPPDSPAMQMLVQAYTDRSPDGPDHLAELLPKTFAMFAAEPTLTVDELATIACPALVVVGDDDLIVLEHTIALYRALPDARLAVVPGTSHGLPLEKPDLLARLVVDFLADPSPPQTLMPVLRSRRV